MIRRWAKTIGERCALENAHGLPIVLVMVSLTGCAPDLGRACRSLADKGVVRDCSQATISAIRKQHHVVEQWDFREPKDGSGYGSIIRYDTPESFSKESQDTAAVAKELSGFHYENRSKLVQLETRYETDSAHQSQVVIVLDDL